MLAAGIMNQRGINIVTEKMTIHIWLASIKNKNYYFVAMDRPTYPSPKRPVKANPRMITYRGGNQLDCQSQWFLQHILYDNAVVMVQEGVYSDDDEDKDPMLMEEMVVEEQRWKNRGRRQSRTCQTNLTIRRNSQTNVGEQ